MLIIAFCLFGLIFGSVSPLGGISHSRALPRGSLMLHFSSFDVGGGPLRCAKTVTAAKTKTLWKGVTVPLSLGHVAPPPPTPTPTPTPPSPVMSFHVEATLKKKKKIKSTALHPASRGSVWTPAFSLMCV